jgi:hypothetical protein
VKWEFSRHRSSDHLTFDWINVGERNLATKKNDGQGDEEAFYMAPEVFVMGKFH